MFRPTALLRDGCEGGFQIGVSPIVYQCLQVEGDRVIMVSENRDCGYLQFLYKGTLWLVPEGHVSAGRLPFRERVKYHEQLVSAGKALMVWQLTKDEYLRVLTLMFAFHSREFDRLKVECEQKIGALKRVKREIASTVTVH